MCHVLPVHHHGMAFLAGSKAKIQHNNLNHNQSINLYCKNQFHSNYKIDEQILKNPTDPTKKELLMLNDNTWNHFDACKQMVTIKFNCCIVIKPNEGVSMNEWSILRYKDISLILFSKNSYCLLLVWEIDGETYTQWGDIIWSHIFFRKPGGANACPSLQAVLSERSETPLIGCVSLVRLLILWTLSKSDRVVITGFSSG